MPIRINLLAEAHAAEELRRKDPVKRALYAGVLCVFLVGLWASTLQVKIMARKGELGNLANRWRKIEKEYQAAVDSHRAINDAEQKLTALRVMSTNRFLWGNALNGLQQTLNGLEDVRVSHFKGDQLYSIGDEVKPRTNGVQIIPGKPATATERITVTLDAVAASPNVDPKINKFKESITAVAYFKDNLNWNNGVVLTRRSAPSPPKSGGGLVVNFTLECNFPEKTR
jgi:hypothetical protein